MPVRSGQHAIVVLSLHILKLDCLMQIHVILIFMLILTVCNAFLLDNNGGRSLIPLVVHVRPEATKHDLF